MSESESTVEYLHGKQDKSKKGSVPKDENGKPSRLRHTNLMVTINTNQVVEQSSEDFNQLVDKLRNSITSVFKESFIHDYCKLSKKAVPGSQLNDEWFKPQGRQTVFACEVGPQSKRLHAHVGIFIPHYTYIDIELDKLKSDIKEVMKLSGWDNVYINTTYDRSSSKSEQCLLDYISKNPAQ